MTRKIKIISTVFVVILALSIVAANASNNSSTQWELFEDSHYSVLKTDKGESVLIKKLQDKDFLEINEALIDKKAKKLSDKELKKIKEDPLAVMTDNYLPNGSKLKENWEEIKTKKIKDKSNSRLMNGKESSNKEIELSIGDKGKFKFKKIKTMDGYITLPSSPETFPLIYEVSKNGKKTIVASFNGVWTIDSDSDEVNLLTQLNDTEMDELSKQSIECFGEDYVVANDAVLVDPKGEKVAFVSNKNRIKEGISELFIVDIKTGEEVIIGKSTSESYYPIAWLDKDEILSSRVQDGHAVYCAVNVDGTVEDVDMKGDYPSILSVQGNHIAYTEYLGSNTVHIIEFSGGETSYITSITCEGTIRERAGYNGFSPDGTKFATLFIPNKRNLTSYVMISDLKTKSNSVIDDLPSGEEYIFESSWLDKDALLLVTGKTSKDMTEETTWIYNVKEGEKNEK